METKKFKQASLRRGLLSLVILAVVALMSNNDVYAFNCSDPNDLALVCFEDIFKNALKSIFALAGIVSFLFIIKGGISYTTAGGDTKAVDAARKTLTGAFIGLGLAIGAYFIMQLISQTFGADILKFVIPPPA